MEHQKPASSRSRTGILLGILLIAGVGLTTLGAEPPSRTKNPYDLMAGFIQAFPAFVEWPARVMATNAIATNKPAWRIGVLGEDPFDGALAVAVKDRQINGRSYLIFHAATLKELPPCDIIYLTSKDSAELEEQLAQLKSQPVLTIGQGEEFLKLGGIVQMEIRQKMRFNVDLDHARAAGLKLNVKMLELATHIISNGTKIK